MSGRWCCSQTCWSVSLKRVFSTMQGTPVPGHELLCIFDADQVASKDFFLKTLPLFDGGDDVGMVLSPQVPWPLLSTSPACPYALSPPPLPCPSNHPCLLACASLQEIGIGLSPCNMAVRVRSLQSARICHSRFKREAMVVGIRPTTKFRPAQSPITGSLRSLAPFEACAA